MNICRTDHQVPKLKPKWHTCRCHQRCTKMTYTEVSVWLSSVWYCAILTLMLKTATWNTRCQMRLQLNAKLPILYHLYYGTIWWGEMQQQSTYTNISFSWQLMHHRRCNDQMSNCTCRNECTYRDVKRSRQCQIMYVWESENVTHWQWQNDDNLIWIIKPTSKHTWFNLVAGSDLPTFKALTTLKKGR